LLFGSILLILPATSILVSILRSRSLFSRLIAVVIIIPLFILGYINKDTNRDHPFYGIRSAERYEITSSEYAGLVYLEKNPKILEGNSLKVDFRLWDYYKYYWNNPAISYWEMIELKPDGIFSIRDIYYTHRIALVGDSIDFLDFSSPHLNLIYDSGDMKWFGWFPK
jgi:hypothetical protein